MSHYLDTLGVVSIKVLSAIVSFLAGIYITNNFTPSNAGIYFVSVSGLLYLSSLSRFGFINTIVKNYSIFNQKQLYREGSSLINFSLYLVSFISVILIILVTLYSNEISIQLFQTDNYSQLISFFALAVLPLSIIGILSAYYNSLKKFLLSIVILNFATNFIFLLSLFFFKITNLQSLISNYIFSVSIVGFFSLVFFVLSRKNYDITFFNFTSPSPKIITESFSFFLIVLFNQTQQVGGQLLGALSLTNSQSAVLAVCLSISGIMLFLVSAITTVFSPAISTAESTSELSYLFKKSVKIAFIFSLPFCLMFLFLGPQILNLYGSEYISGYQVLIVLVLTNFLNVICGPVGAFLSMTGHHNYTKNITFVSTCFFIFLMFFLPQRFDVIGVAFSMTFSIILFNVLALVFLKKKLNISLF